MKHPITKYLGLAALILITSASLAANVMFFMQVRTLKADPQYLATKQNDATIAAVRRLMILPDEQPTVATVTDPEKLKSQSFFANAKAGDRVLIFTQAKKAVLYDPVADKIVEVAPLVSTPNAPAAADQQPGFAPDVNAATTSTGAKTNN